ncbi:MAG: efflux RND transporter periplasmic adaptor subunit [Gammaproteobacteria bacterium]
MANTKKNRFFSILVSYGLVAVTYSQGVTGAEESSSDTVTVMESQVGSSITLGGSVVPFRKVTLSAQIPGRVDFIAGSEGDKFSGNQVLVAINDASLLAKRRAALAEFNNTTASIQNARMQYSRELYSPQSKRISGSPGMGMPSMFDQFVTQPMADVMPGNAGGDPWLDRQADLYSQGTQLSQAQGQQIRARAQIEEIDTKIRDARSVAPFPGTILRKLVEVGDTVQPGQALLKYADTTYLQAQIEVPARHVQHMSKGMMIPAKLDVGNNRFDARVAKIFPVADSQRHTVTVKLDLPQGIPAGPGMYVEIMVPDKSSSASSMPLIPISAVMWRGSLPAVFVVTDKDKTQLRMVRLGDQVGNDMVSVLSGLKAGERIKTNPSAGQASGWSSGRIN